MIALTVVALAAIAALLYLLVSGRSDVRLGREAWERERSLLLNRIKPETAQAAPGEPVFPSPPAVIPDDDEAFWAARGVDVSEVR